MELMQMVKLAYLLILIKWSDIDDISKIMDNKIKRQLERIKNE